MKLKNGFYIFLLIFSFPLANTLHASPRWLRLSWTSIDSTDSTMTVAWTDTDGSGGNVEYRPSGGTSSTVSAAAEDTGSGVLDVTYEATLTGLLPSTAYEYRVQSGGAWSDWKTFATPPPVGACNPVRIAIGGDGRGGEAFWDPGYVSRHWDNIAGYIKNEMPNLMIYSGDIVHDGSEDVQWEEWLNVSEFITSEVPFMTIMGNHDDGPGEGDNQWYNKIFALPKSGAGLLSPAFDPDGNGVEDFWAIVVGNILMVGLSTEGVDPAVQQTFLQDTIAAWDWRVDWKFVFFHRPLWSSGAHGNNEGNMLDADNLIGIIDDYGVDFVICGHDHDYERLHPSRGGYGGRPRVVNPLPDDGGNSGIADGTIHIVSGGAGSFTNFVMFCRVDGCFVSSGNLNYMVFDIMGDRASVVTRDLGPILTLADATMRPDPMDVFTVYKRSSICDTLPDEVPEEVDAVEPVEPPVEVPDEADAAQDDAAAADWDSIAPPDGEEEQAGEGEENHAGAGCGCVLVQAASR
jgi:hypothetical protein